MLQGIKPGAALTTVLGIAVALATAVFHLTTAEAATAASLATAIGTIVSAFHGGSKVDLAVLTGGAGVLLTDLTLFNVHLSSGQVSAAVSVISLVLGALMHVTSTEPVHNPAALPAPGRKTG